MHMRCLAWCARVTALFSRRLPIRCLKEIYLLLPGKESGCIRMYVLRMFFRWGTINQEDLKNEMRRLKMPVP